MTTLSNQPDKAGRFGEFGGRYVPETLIAALNQLEEAYSAARNDPTFQNEFDELMATYVGRPTPLTFAASLTAHCGGASIYLKREDLAHTGAHKINNTIGQALLTKRMGKKRVIAETGAGQHGVATATACAHFGLKCEVYMGSEDVRRQALNVFRMELLGAKVITVDSGSRTLKDATNEAMRDWMGSVETTHYILGSVVGPHPFPMIVRDFQSVIGTELREQFALAHEIVGLTSHDRKGVDGVIDTSSQPQPLLAHGESPRRPDGLGSDEILPDCIVACVGGGSNAAGVFYPFIEDEAVKLVGVEAGGHSLEVGKHAAPLCLGSPGVLHGSLSYVLQDKFGQTQDVHSCSAGLDYPGVGPEHSYWKDTDRVQYTSVTDKEALDSFQLLARLEGIIPALESAHAVAGAIKQAATMSPDQTLVINLSGRGDKDVEEVQRLLGFKKDGLNTEYTEGTEKKKRP